MHQAAAASDHPGQSILGSQRPLPQIAQVGSPGQTNCDKQRADQFKQFQCQSYQFCNGSNRSLNFEFFITLRHVPKSNLIKA